MADQPDSRPTPPIPKPPSREDLARISEAQEMITDDWTGDGGQPAQDVPRPEPSRTS